MPAPRVFALNRRTHGFVRVAALVPKVIPMAVGYGVDPTGTEAIGYNVGQMITMARDAAQKGVQVGVFPELGITAYSCRDAFFDPTFLDNARLGLLRFVEETKDLGAVFFVGLPLPVNGMLFNVAAIVNRGKILGFVPKSFIPTYGPHEEKRWFTRASDLNATAVRLPGYDGEIPIGIDLLVDVESDADASIITVGAEICEDGWHRRSPSGLQAANGALLCVNLSASPWIVGKDEYRHTIFSALSGDIVGAYVYCACGHGESTDDVVWDGDAFVAQNGSILASSERWSREGQLVIADIDAESLMRERWVTGTFAEVAAANRAEYRHVLARVDELVLETKSAYRPPKLEVIDGGRSAHLKFEAPAGGNRALRRAVTRKPFVPRDPETMGKRCRDVISGVGQGLMVRLESMARAQLVREGKNPYTEPLPVQDVYYGHSGGRDSTFVGEVILWVYDQLGWDRKHIHAVRMPGPASSDATQDLSMRRCVLAGVDVITNPIEDQTARLLRSEGHEPCWNNDDPAKRRCGRCQNAQARMRTLILMTYGFVVGTGDLTEIMTGWCTYNGDHMSMYNPNAGVPKTLVEHLIRWIAMNWRDGEERQVLLEILAEIVSPELVKARPGEPIQSTEGEDGPVQLKDFFIYWFRRHGSGPTKIAYLAEIAFAEQEDEGDELYDRATILKWLRRFFVKFQEAQFKRNAAPSGPLMGSVGASQRGNLRWHSDADIGSYVKEIDALIAALDRAA